MSGLNGGGRSKLRDLGNALGKIQRGIDEAKEQLMALESLLDPRVANWKCDGCGYTKQFTKPTTVVACDSCPRCPGHEFLVGGKVTLFPALDDEAVGRHDGN